MKRMLAVVVALMLIFSCTAMAEKNAAAMTVDNIALSFAGTNVDLGDLSATLAVDASADPTLCVSVDKADENLFLAAMALAGNTVKVMVNGVDATYVQSFSELDQYAAMIPMIAQLFVPMLDYATLPPFGGMTVPKADLTSMLDGHMTGANTFAFSEEEVYAMIDTLVDYMKQAASTLQSGDIQQVVSAVEQLKSSGIGFTIDGTVNDDGTTLVAVANLYMSQNGQSGGDAIAVLTLTSTENNSTLDVGVNMGSGLTSVAQFDLVSDPEIPQLDASMNIGGMANMAFSVFPEDGLQKITFDASASGQSFGFEFGYGNVNGTDVLLVNVSAPQASMSFSTESAMGADGVRTGNMYFVAEMQGQKAEITADLTMGLYESTDSGIVWPANQLPLEEIQNADMNAAVAPLMEYLNSIEPAA